MDGRHALERRIEATDEKLEAFRCEILGGFEDVYRRLEHLESEYHAIKKPA